MTEKQDVPSTIPLPNVKDSLEKKGVLHFTMENVNVSVANALRRTILSDIETVVMNPKDSNFIVNTSRFNNEILKQRLGCIPIHIKDFEDIDSLQIEIDESNEVDSIQYVTTQEFQIKNLSNDKYLTESFVKTVFPHNKMTQSYVLFARLRPRISNEIPGERIKLTCKLSLGTAKEDGMYNIASTCAYGNTPNPVEQSAKWQEIEEALEKKGGTASDITYYRQNWYTMEAKRYFKPDSFDFKVESVGVFTNMEIIHKACNKIVSRLNALVQKCDEESVELFKDGTATANTVDIKLMGYSYTIGKLVEYILYSDYYMNTSTLSYIGFIKRHPHDDHSILRLTFSDSGEFTDMNIYRMLKFACLSGINIFTNMKEYF